LTNFYTLWSLDPRGKCRLSDDKKLTIVGTGLPDGPFKEYKPLLRTVEDAGPYKSNNVHGQKPTTSVIESILRSNQ